MGLLGFIGLDGMAWHIIFSYADYGCFKNLLRMAKHSICAVNICHPPYTPPSWTTIFTGVRPSTHKIFGFMRPHIVDGKIEFKAYSALDLKYPRLSEILAMCNLRGIVVNHPFSYPITGWYAKNQIIVSDDISPTNFIYPPKYNKYLKYFKRKVRGMRGDDRWLTKLNDLLWMKIDGVLKLIDEYSADFLIIVFKEPDTIMHYLPYVARGVVNEKVCKVFETIDDFVGTVSKLFKNVVITSDHGFDVYDKRINLYYALSVLSNTYDSSIKKSILSIILQSEISRIMTKWFLLNKRLIKIFYTTRRLLRQFLSKPYPLDILRPNTLYTDIALDPIDSSDAFVLYVANLDKATMILKHLYKYFKEYIDHIEPVKLHNGIICLVIYFRKKYAYFMHLDADPRFPRARVLKFALARHSPYGIFIFKRQSEDATLPTSVENVDVLPTILQALKIPLPAHLEGVPIINRTSKILWNDCLIKWKLLRRSYWIGRAIK